MKPLKLEFQAFGPYRGHEIVDFEKLKEKKLFLICGETGSGKTMILDAMTFALFGKDNSDARSDLEELRCNQAEFDEDTFVKFTFSNNGETYIFERKLIGKRTNFSKEQNVYRIDENGNRSVVFENCKDADINSYAEEIIGLNREQFRQIIILPQGKFESFLLAKPDDKQEILSNIFDVNKWKEISMIFYKKAEDEYKRVKGYMETASNRISVYGCETSESFYELLTKTVEEKESLEKEYKNADYQKQLELLESDKKTAERFRQLHLKENVLREIDGKKGEIESIQSRLDLSKKAQNVSPFAEKYETVKNELSARQKKADSVKFAFEEAKAAKEEAQTALDSHIKDKETIDKKAEGKAVLESKEDIYLKIDSAKKDFETSRNNLEKAKIKLELQQRKCETNAKRIDALRTVYNENSETYTQMFNRYNDGISGELASELEENKPCPVCGSVSHPKPAQKLEGAPSRQELDKFKKTLDKSYSDWNDAENNVSKDKKELEQIQNEFNAFNTAFELARKEIENIEQNKIEGIECLRELQEKAREIQRSIDGYSVKLKTLSEKAESKKETFQNCDANMKTATEELSVAQEMLKKAEDDLQKSLRENSFDSLESAKQSMFDDEKRTKLQQEIADYNAAVTQTKSDIKAISEELEGKDEKDGSEIIRKTAEINAKIREYTQNVAKLEERISGMKKAKDDVDELYERFNNEIKQAEDDFNFAKSFRGDTGIGIQRYVLAIMFNKVIAEANQMLKNVHGGRYHLFRSDDIVAGSKKRGLNLKVHDNYSPEKEGRNVALLSGGEKFLVSLSLAIGMSSVAQKSGVRIEAMFIDEGFGTLDEKSIDDALDILQSVQKANGVVGIISHVQILEDNINEKLEVIKSSKGSTIRSTF